MTAYTQEARLKALLMEALRTYDPKMLDRQYRAGVLTQGRKVPGLPEKRVDLCPMCSCSKSGDAEEPNSRDEWCDEWDWSCLCHAEEDEPRAEVLAMFDRELGR